MRETEINLPVRQFVQFGKSSSSIEFAKKKIIYKFAMFYHFFLTIMRRKGLLKSLVNDLCKAGCCAAVAFQCVSCSFSDDGTFAGTGKAVLYLNVCDDNSNATSPDSRTVISGDDLDKVQWSEKDRISFYYSPQNAGNLQYSELGIYRVYSSRAIFSGNIETESGVLYDCFAAYPQPTSVSGMTAVYNLPSEQNGLYNSSIDGTSNDIMVAVPAPGIELGSRQDVELDMNFVHKCHVFRIQIPKGRNIWGKDIRKIRVEFPVPVVGTLSVDLSNQDAAPVLSDGVNTVWLNLEEMMNESEEDSKNGSYAWLFTAPVQVSGEVKFTMYSGENYQSETLSVSMEKMLEAGRITPVNLTVPVELPVSEVSLKIAGNNLGEDFNTITVTAPEGGKFRNGSGSVTLQKNADDVYKLEFYEKYDGIDNLSILKSDDMQVTFESDHAIVSDVASLSGYEAGGESEQEISVTVPYLLYEDFSGASQHDGGENTDMLDAYNLPGWSASHYGIWEGQVAEIRLYASTISALTKSVTYGRIDSPALSGLKTGVTANLSVSFDIGGTSTSDINSTLYSLFSFGVDSRTGAIANSESIQNLIIEKEDPGTDGSSTNLPLHKSVELQSVTRNNRLSWQTDYKYDRGAFGSITRKTVYVYIDNIKVSIKNN